MSLYRVSASAFEILARTEVNFGGKISPRLLDPCFMYRLHRTYRRRDYLTVGVFSHRFHWFRQKGYLLKLLGYSMALSPIWGCIFKVHISGGSRIFPRGVRQLPKVLLFFNFFAENCMKMKEFGPLGGARVPGAPPWIRQCTWNPYWWLSVDRFHTIITARKRSLGQGNVFTPVCQSFWSQWP